MTKQLADEAARLERASPTAYTELMRLLVAALRSQDARIAALERRPPGPPLEGTGPLPLERKGG